MAIYAPTITSYPDGIVSITSTDGTPYYQIQNSMGESRYFLNSIYIKASNNQQLLKPLEFFNYDANGNAQKYVEVTLIDIFQIQSALKIDMKGHKVVFDGNTFLNIKLLPLESIIMNFDITEKANSDLIPKVDFISTNEFFKQFKDEL